MYCRPARPSFCSFSARYVAHPTPSRTHVPLTSDGLFARTSLMCIGVILKTRRGAAAHREGYSCGEEAQRAHVLGAPGWLRR